MKYRVLTGKEGLIGQEAEVVSKSTTKGRTKYTIHVKGELWTALSNDGAQLGEKVIIKAFEGSMPVVERKDSTIKGELEKEGG